MAQQRIRKERSTSKRGGSDPDPDPVPTQVNARTADRSGSAARTISAIDREIASGGK